MILVTRFFEPFRELPSVSRIAASRFLDDRGAEVKALHQLSDIAEGRAALRHYSSGRTVDLGPIDHVLCIGPQVPNDGCVEELKNAGIGDVRVIGDAYAPRRLRHAINEANALARVL